MFAGSAIISIAFLGRITVAQPTNETKAGAGILPDTELNPLVNPLLAAHMGRWAEVYFTSPPERRAQAVSDLVRELSGDSSSPVSAPTVSSETIWPKVRDEAAEVSSPNSEPPPVQCESCGHQNAATQRFCGMCGAPLTSSPEPLQPFEEPEPIVPARWNEADAVRGDVQERRVETPPASAYSSTDYRAPLNSSWPPPENTPAEFTMLSDYQSEPARHPYRIYVGLFVAIVLGLLVYRDLAKQLGILEQRKRARRASTSCAGGEIGSPIGCWATGDKRGSLITRPASRLRPLPSVPPRRVKIERFKIEASPRGK